MGMEVNRVEGDMEIQVELECGVVTDAWCSGTMYRGYEQILTGRDPADALVITPRICGICSNPPPSPPPPTTPATATTPTPPTSPTHRAPHPQSRAGGAFSEGPPPPHVFDVRPGPMQRRVRRPSPLRAGV